ncbi:hypothetical protein AB4Z47_07200 [Nocardia sp. 2TAF39]
MESFQIGTLPNRQHHRWYSTSATPKARHLAMFVLIFAQFMNLLDVTIVNVALPRSGRICTPLPPNWSGLVVTQWCSPP